MERRAVAEQQKSAHPEATNRDEHDQKYEAAAYQRDERDGRPGRREANPSNDCG